MADACTQHRSCLLLSCHDAVARGATTRDTGRGLALSSMVARFACLEALARAAVVVGRLRWLSEGLAPQCQW